MGTVLARRPSGPIIAATLAGAALNTAYPPQFFTVGDLLYIRDQDALFLCVLDSPTTRTWFPVSGGGATMMASDLAPIEFAGGLTQVEINPLTVYLGNSSGVTNSTDNFPTRVSYVKSLTGMFAVGVRNAEIYVTQNTLAAGNVTVEVLVNNASLAVPLIATIPFGYTGAAFTNSSVQAIADGSTIDLRLVATGGEAANVVKLTAAVNFETI